MAVPPRSIEESKPESPSLTSMSLLDGFATRISRHGKGSWHCMARWSTVGAVIGACSKPMPRSCSGGLSGRRGRNRQFPQGWGGGDFSAAGFGPSPGTRQIPSSLSCRRPQAVGGTDLQVRLGEIPDRCPEESTCEEASAETSSLIGRAMDVIRGDFQERTWRAFLRTAVDGLDATQVRSSWR